jgi:insertion element IS1 protein InsB
MDLVPVCCPLCRDANVVKRCKTEQGKQRYLCLNDECPKRTFIMDYAYNGLLPDVKVQIIDMALNGSGIRDTARVLRVSPNTVINELKKRNHALSLSTASSRNGQANCGLVPYRREARLPQFSLT